MSTHRLPATAPTTSSFNGRTPGVICQFLRITSRVTGPVAIGHALSQSGNMRSTSSRAWSSVAPCLSRASMLKLKLLIVALAGSSRKGMITSGCGVISRNLKTCGMMPTTCHRPAQGNDVALLGASIVSVRPSTASSPPNRRCQNA